MSLLFVSEIWQSADEPVVHNKNSRRYKRLLEETLDEADYPETQLIWRLARFHGILHDPMEWFPIMPGEEIPGILTAEYVLEQLNTASCFEWEYEAQEGDYLKVHAEYIAQYIAGKERAPLWDYLAFVYTNGIWDNGYYDYDADLRPFNSGRIVFTD